VPFDRIFAQRKAYRLARTSFPNTVMLALVASIHDFFGDAGSRCPPEKVVDGRLKADHDD